MPITINGNTPLAAVIKFINDNDYDAVDHGNGNIEIVKKTIRLILRSAARQNDESLEFR